MNDISDEQLEHLYGWVDEIPLSREKKNIAKDFSDGVLVAEVIKHHFPKFIELHNYTPANNSTKKRSNWLYLNRILYKRFKYELSDDTINDLIKCKHGTIEKVLMDLRSRIDKMHDDLAASTVASDYSKSTRKGGGRPAYESDMPEVDQNMDPLRGTKGRAKGQQRLFNTQSDLMTKMPPVDPRLLKDPDLASLYQEKALECAQKEETIQILHAKVRRLEHLASLKDTRIDDLTSHLNNLQLAGGLRK